RRMGVADRVRFELGDYTATSFPDASFDAVWTLESLCHAPDKPAFLREARRLLRPGGRLGIVEYMRTERALTPAEDHLMQQWFACWAIANLGADSDFHRWVKLAGFEATELADITPQMLPSFRRLYRLALAVYPVATLLRALRLATQV